MKRRTPPPAPSRRKYRASTLGAGAQRLFLLFVVTAAALLSLPAEPQGGATYTAVNLTPAGATHSLAHGAGGGKQVGLRADPRSWGRALLWSGSAASAIDLTPRGYDGASAWGTDGRQQVGYGYPHATSRHHALLWSGTASSAIDLHPDGFEYSYALGVGGGQQVGSASVYFDEDARKHHAMLWSGNAATVVDLHPPLCRYSSAIATDGKQQVGWADVPLVGAGAPVPPPVYHHLLPPFLWDGQSGYAQHALLWNGSAMSFVDLHPEGFDGSQACGVAHRQQVGYGYRSYYGRREVHALAWKGTSSTVVDLHPRGFETSYAWATNGARQVGYGSFRFGGSYRTHALAWGGSAGRVIDLHRFLPAGYTDSVAHGIDAAGNIAGEASGVNAQTGERYYRAFLWRPAR